MYTFYNLFKFAFVVLVFFLLFSGFECISQNSLEFI